MSTRVSPILEIKQGPPVKTSTLSITSQLVGRFFDTLDTTNINRADLGEWILDERARIERGRDTAKEGESVMHKSSGER